jgi:protein gp37
MSNKTSIEWCDRSSNPIRALNVLNGKRGHYCAHVSPGCANCYAGRLNVWRGNGLEFTAQNERHAQPFVVEKEIASWGRLKPGTRVFVCDMTDLFLDLHPDEMIDRIFAGFALASQAIFQVLTKRPERLRDYILSVGQGCRDVGSLERGFRLARWVRETWGAEAVARLEKTSEAGWWEWQHMPNVWLGTSVEDQRRADERIPLLLATPAAVRFLSCEPLLGSIDLRHVQDDGTVEIDALTGDHGVIRPLRGRSDARISWVIGGGESGSGARPCHPEWALSLRDQCRSAGVAFFWKQWGAWAPGSGGTGRLAALADDGTLYDAGDLAYPNGARYGEALRAGHDRARLTVMRRVGKKSAGRLLDGRTWDEFPEVRAHA